MKTIKAIIAACLLLTSFVACNNHNDNEQAAKDMNNQKDSTGAMNAVDDKDSKFAVDAAAGGMMEVELGNIAQQKAMNQRVKDFGTMMVSDHSKANDKLKNIASDKNITVPSALGDDKQKMVNELSSKSGADFDKSYMDMMVNDHKEDIKEFQDAANSAKDSDLMQFASSTLPTLQTHLDSAQAIYDAIKKMKK